MSTFAALLLATLVLVSPDVRNGATIPARFTLNANGCTGQNVVPRLRWSGVPRGTKSLALTLFDPDAGKRGWLHWIVVRIPPRERSSTDFARDGAVQGRNDFGRPGYGGPCPPPGQAPHHYVFTLYALGDVPPASASASIAALRAATRGHVLATAMLTARYGR